MIKLRDRVLDPVSVLTLCLLLCTSAPAAPFVNLDFEQSTVQHSDPQVVPTSAAFPGWTARFGNTVSSSVYHDYAGAGEPIVAVYDEPFVGGATPLLQGRYMPVLAPGTSNTRTSLSQIGDIPSDAKSLTLLCDGLAKGPILRVNGVVVPTVYVSGIPFGGEINTYGADISSFAGQTAEVAFDCAPSRPGVDTGHRAFDDVRFSSTPIPEPAVSMVLVVGGIVCTLQRSNSHGRRRPCRITELIHGTWND